MSNRLLKKTITGAILNIANVVIQVVLGLFVFKEMLSFFGEQDFGKWTVICALLSHVSLVEFGLGSVITRQIALVGDGIDKRKRILSTAFYSLVCIGLIFLIIFAFCAVVYKLTDHHAYFNDGTSILLVAILLGFSFFFSFVSGAIQAFLLGKFKFKTVNIIRLIVNLIRALGVIGGLYMGLGIISVAITFFISALIELTCRYYFAAKLAFQTEISFAMVDAKTFKYIQQRGIRFVFLRMNDYVRNNAGIILTSFLLSSVAVVPLRISGRLMEIFSEVLVSINLLLTPYFSKYASSSDKAFNRKFEISLLVSSFISLIIYFNILAHGKWFLDLWLGRYSPIALDALFILSFAFTITNMQGPVNSMLIAKDHYKTLSYLSISEFVLTLALMFVLILPYGVLGAIYALTISMVLIRGLLQPILVCRVLSISIYRYITPGLSVASLLFVFFKGVEWATKLIQDVYLINYVASYLIIEIFIFAIVLAVFYLKIMRD